jgi:serine/threonine protein kinase
MIATTNIQTHVEQWLADFNSYKKVCEQFRKSWFGNKPKNAENHVLKDRLGIEEYAKLLLNLLPATTLARALPKERIIEINKYLKENAADILKYGYVTEETSLDHKTKTAAKGGALVKATSHLPGLEISNFLKVFTSEQDYHNAVSAEDRLAPLFPDLVLKYALKDDKNLVLAYPFVEGQTLFDRFKQEEKDTLVQKAVDMFTELHLCGKTEAEHMPAPCYTEDFRKYFFGRMGCKPLDELVDLFDRHIGQPLSQEPQSLVHGDAKTKNVLITTTGKLYLIDLELAKRDTIHYDLYRFLDSANITQEQEAVIVKQVFDKLKSAGFYEKDYEQFNKAYALNKIVGDLFSAARIFDISKNLSDANQQDIFRKLASRYYTKALGQMETFGMQELKTRMIEYFRNSQIPLEVLSEEELRELSSTYDLSREGLTTLLESENVQLRFPRQKKKSNWAKKLGIAAALAGAMIVPYIITRSGRTDVQTDNRTAIADLDPMLEIHMVQKRDEERIKEKPLGSYFKSIPLKFKSKPLVYETEIFTGQESFWSYYLDKEFEKNPTILTNEKFDELFLNPISKEYRGLGQRINDNMNRFSNDKHDFNRFGTILRSIIFTNLLDVQFRQDYIKEGCSPITLLPKYVYDKYGYNLSDENFENGKWTDLICDYLKDIIIAERGDVTKAVVAYYNHQTYSKDMIGLPSRERKNLDLYDYDKKDESICITRYEKQLDDTMKFYTRQALMLIANANRGPY